MIRVDQGSEYAGETYIWCDVCIGFRSWFSDVPGQFAGQSIEELQAFIEEHQHT